MEKCKHLYRFYVILSKYKQIEKNELQTCDEINHQKKLDSGSKQSRDEIKMEASYTENGWYLASRSLEVDK